MRVIGASNYYQMKQHEETITHRRKHKIFIDFSQLNEHITG